MKINDGSDEYKLISIIQFSKKFFYFYFVHIYQRKTDEKIEGHIGDFYDTTSHTKILQEEWLIGDWGNFGNMEVSIKNKVLYQI